MCLFSLHVCDACSTETESSDIQLPASLEYDTRRIVEQESVKKNSQTFWEIGSFAFFAEAEMRRLIPL